MIGDIKNNMKMPRIMNSMIFVAGDSLEFLESGRGKVSVLFVCLCCRLGGLMTGDFFVRNEVSFLFESRFSQK